MMTREEEVAAYVMLQAKQKYARHPRKLERVTPQRCLNVARMALKAEPHAFNEETVAAQAVAEEQKVSGGIILTIIVQVIIKVLAYFAIEYIKRKRASNGTSGSSGGW